MSDIAMLTGTVDPQSGMVMQPDRRMVRFETVPTQNMVKSREMGRPVYDPVTVLFVRHPGERDETAIAMQEHHKYEFPRQWAAFEAGAKVDPGGTPLAVLFPAEPHIISHLRGLHIFTVEMLAGCGEEGLRRIGMGAREYVTRAQQLIDASERRRRFTRSTPRCVSATTRLPAKEQVALLAASTRKRSRTTADEGADA